MCISWIFESFLFQILHMTFTHFYYKKLKIIQYDFGAINKDNGVFMSRMNNRSDSCPLEISCLN